MVVVTGFFWGLIRSLRAPGDTSQRAGLRDLELRELELREREMEARLAKIEGAVAELSAAVVSAPAAGARKAPPAGPDRAVAGPERVPWAQERLHDRAGAAPGRAAAEEERGRYVTREEFAAALDRTERRMEKNVSDQMGRQSAAIVSLRAMILDTDALLERVLERLEASIPESAHSGGGNNGRAPDEESILSLKKPVRTSVG